VQRGLAAVSKPYEALADAFAEGNKPKMMAEIDIAQSWWKVWLTIRRAKQTANL
jgi:hypothetical protein